MNYMNRTIIIESDSRHLTQRVTQVLGGYDDLSETLAETQAAATAAIAASENAVTASENAMTAAQEAQEAISLQAADLPTLLASTSGHANGTIFLTRKEGYSYEAVAADPDVMTAGGVGLRAIPFVGRVTPGQYGAVGDGVADDTAALMAALQSGYGVDFGDKVYRFTSPLEVSMPVVDLISGGAKLFYDPPAATRRCVSFTMPLNGTFLSVGRLVIDANGKAFDAFAAGAVAVYTDAVESWPTLTASDLTIRNARRSSLAFPGGNGVEVLGGFRSVILTRPDVRNCTMAAGAEVFGAQGIFGITVGRVSGTNPISPDYVLIEDPYVDYVGADDPAYLNDQDGIRIFSERRRDGVAPDKRMSAVRGGVIRNARNRSIKMQTQNGLIEGVMLKKDQAVLNLPNGMTINPDIDWQINGGITRNITVHYDQASPPEIVRLVTHRVDETFTSGILDGVAGYINLNPLATAPILAYANADPGVVVTKHDAKVMNVSIKGPISEALRIAQRGVSSDRATVENIDAEITTCVFAPTSSTDGVLFAFARNVWNRGAVGVPMMINVTGNRIASGQGCSGLSPTSTNYYDGFGQPLRVDAIMPQTPRIAAALVPMTKTLADGETWELPRQGIQGGCSVMLVSTTIDSSAQGVIGLGNGARSLGVGPTIGVGLNAEPGTGGIKIWQPSGEGAKIKNAFGSTRTVSVILFG